MKKQKVLPATPIAEAHLLHKGAGEQTRVQPASAENKRPNELLEQLQENGHVPRLLAKPFEQHLREEQKSQLQGKLHRGCRERLRNLQQRHASS